MTCGSIRHAFSEMSVAASRKLRAARPWTQEELAVRSASPRGTSRASKAAARTWRFRRWRESHVNSVRPCARCSTSRRC